MSRSKLGPWAVAPHDPLFQSLKARKSPIRTPHHLGWEPLDRDYELKYSKTTSPSLRSEVAEAVDEWVADGGVIEMLPCEEGEA